MRFTKSSAFFSKGPFDDGCGAEDSVVEELINDVDADAGLVFPVFHHAFDDLLAGIGRCGTKG